MRSTSFRSHSAISFLPFGAAQKALDSSAGFSGEIVFLDNGDSVFPRLTCAKFPRRREVFSPAERAERFLREIKLQTAAHYHPNVHWPFDVIFILGTPIAFFRRWEGDLSDFIEDPRWGDLGRLSLLIQLSASLAHGHRRGLVHQDLKPQNIFVRDLRTNFSLPPTDLWFRPLVADFGSVNLAADIGVFTGSRPYMAPEQWHKTKLGEWTSVFAFGIMLHEIMSRGVHPTGERSRDWHRQINSVLIAGRRTTVGEDEWETAAQSRDRSPSRFGGIGGGKQITPAMLFVAEISGGCGRPGFREKYLASPLCSTTMARLRIVDPSSWRRRTTSRVDTRNHRHTRSQTADILLAIDDDFHGDSLDDFREVARGVVGGQQRKLESASR